MFFLDTPGGISKTVRGGGDTRIAIAVTSSGIIVVVVEEDITCHAVFKPFNLKKVDCLLYIIFKQGNIVQVFKDECTMAHKANIEALNRTFRCIRNDNSLMGIVAVLFAGEFRQTLFVVPRDTRVV